MGLYKPRGVAIHPICLYIVFDLLENSRGASELAQEYSSSLSLIQRALGSLWEL